MKQGASGDKSIEKKRKTAIEKFAKQLCELGFCDGVSIKQTDIVIVKENGKKKVQSVTYAYTPYGEGEVGEIIHTTIGRHRFQIIRLAEFDMTGAYVEQVAKIISYMKVILLKKSFMLFHWRNYPK